MKTAKLINEILVSIEKLIIIIIIRNLYSAKTIKNIQKRFT